MLPNIILSGTELDSHFRFRNPSTERLYNLSDIIQLGVLSRNYSPGSMILRPMFLNICYRLSKKENFAFTFGIEEAN